MILLTSTSFKRKKFKVNLTVNVLIYLKHTYYCYKGKCNVGIQKNGCLDVRNIQI